MKPEIRAFIAIELSEEVKAFLADVLSFLRKHGGDVRWVKPEGMHLTLKFLGNVPVELIEVIELKTKSLFSKQVAFQLGIKGLGSFPTMKRPRVIWAGCEDSERKLPPLVTELEDVLEPLGFAKEKRDFNPHLTLGRVRSNEGIIDLISAMKQRMNVIGPSFIADHAVLFQSLLSPSGAKYTEVCRFNW